VNPNVTVYVPADGGNGFGGLPFPKTFLRADESLPAKMRYFGGADPEHFAWGKLYDTGNFVAVNQLTEVSPGIFLVRTISQKKGTLELPELTLAIKRPNGLLLVDGCSHAGIEAILEAASAVDPRTEIVFGGLHLVTAPVEEIDGLVENLKTKWKVQRIAPGHCTGEAAFARLKNAYGEKLFVCGVGDEDRAVRMAHIQEWGRLAQHLHYTRSRSSPSYRSTAIATAFPPPRHSAAIPRCTSRRIIS
jgi:7,8-dihydropterin-6-yl-methyl-4-(beta-D-ribofuranosyl)aminobenzene 5'-phosphate synthase